MSKLFLKRAEALELVSFIQMAQLPTDLRESKIEDALAELEITESLEANRNYHLREYLKAELETNTNQYLEGILLDRGFDVSVCDEGPDLFPCRCCNFSTLEKRGEYFICPVCHWEDDGVSEMGKFSSVNKMTLEEGKRNFERIGVVRVRALNTLYPDRITRYK